MNTQYKKWFLTWEPNLKQRKLPKSATLINFLNYIADTAVFQEECGTMKGKIHYQGILTLSGPRQSKTYVLSLFAARFKNIAGLTLQPQYSSEGGEQYVTKNDTRISGPYYCGKKEKFSTEFSEKKLTVWQSELYSFLCQVENLQYFRDRIVITVEDSQGNSGKSFFLKWLRTGQKQLTSRKLPVSSVDRLISAVAKINAEEKVNLFTVNLTRSMGENQSYKDLFAALEEIKDGYVTDVMYGKYVESIFKPPLIVIFTNVNMADYLDKLSADRWLRLKITAKKQIVFHQIGSNAELIETPLRNLDPLEFEKRISIKYLG